VIFKKCGTETLNLFHEVFGEERGIGYSQSQKDFRRYIEGWKTRVKQCVASDGSYIEGDDLQIQDGP